MYPGNVLNNQNYSPAEPLPKKPATRSTGRGHTSDSPLSSVPSPSPPAMIEHQSDAYKKGKFVPENGQGRAESPDVAELDEEEDELMYDEDLQRLNSPGIEESELLASNRESSATPDESWRALQDS